MTSVFGLLEDCLGSMLVQFPWHSLWLHKFRPLQVEKLFGVYDGIIYCFSFCLTFDFDCRTWVGDLGFFEIRLQNISMKKRAFRVNRFGLVVAILVLHTASPGFWKPHEGQTKIIKQWVFQIHYLLTSILKSRFNKWTT